MTNREKELDATALTRFRADTKNHVMKVLHDDGVYRHIVFKDPKNSWYWYELITTPGQLTINGDMGTYVFARINDMFRFFRNEPGYVNAHYWAEKLQANSGARQYAPEVAREYITEAFNDWAEDQTEDERTAAWDDIEWTVLDEIEDEHSTRRNLADSRLDFLTDSWEWDLLEYTEHFRWCLHAIVHGIRRYDRVIGSIV